MSEILFQYKRVDPTTWTYLSSLLLIALYFKFSRIWSVRNLDLILCVLLAPGLLLVYQGQTQYSDAVRAKALLDRVSQPVPQPLAGEDPLTPETFPRKLLALAPRFAPRLLAVADEERLPLVDHEIRQGVTFTRAGYLMLFAISGVWLIRLLLDPTMVRRPLLEPNLTTGGLGFIGICLFVFLMANVISGQTSEEDQRGPRGAQDILTGTDPGRPTQVYRRHGPGYYLLAVLPSIPTMPFVDSTANPNQRVDYQVAAKVMAVLSHLAVVAGIIAIGYLHFDNIRTGVGAATLYLLLPYSAQMTGHVDHVLPAALLVWAVVFYRRPLTAGVFIGLAMGVCYYPFFLIPLWVSFYWHRGLGRFLMGLLATVAVMAFSLIFVAHDLASYIDIVRAMFGIWIPALNDLEGIWSKSIGWDPVFRLPVLTAFVILSGSMAAWPAQKNLGTLLSCSSAIMVATQFWHGYGGGLFMGWYLPLLLMTVFRPNLEDRVALTVLGESWLGRKRKLAGKMERAA